MGDLIERHLLAVDAGNTKTDVISLCRDGTVRRWIRAGCGDIYGPGGEAIAVANVRRATEAAAGGPLENIGVDRISFRLAGLDWPEDTSYWNSVVADDWFYGGNFTLANDGFAGIRLGNLDGIGLAITAGTGIALVARNFEGQEFGLNMLGPHDMGAKGLGEAGFRQIALQNLGMAPSTVLSGRYAQFFDYQNVTALLHSFTARDHRHRKALLATAAPLVTTAALEGDAVAQGIVSEQANLLHSYAVAVAAKVGFTRSARFTIVLGGHVLRAPNSPVTSLLTAILKQEFPAAAVCISELPAVCGAALDVLSESGVMLSSAIRRQLVHTMPAEPELV